MDDNLWTLTLRVRPGPTPAAARVRRLLKIARGYGLDCVRLGGPEEERRAQALKAEYLDGQAGAET